MLQINIHSEYNSQFCRICLQQKVTPKFHRAQLFPTYNVKFLQDYLPEKSCIFSQ